MAARASLNDHVLRLRPDQARALADELNAVLARWLPEHPSDVPAEGTELVERVHRPGAAQGVAVVSAPTTVRSATRRLVGLTALRWLPVGLATPITVLLAQARGLSLAEIGAPVHRPRRRHHR